MVFSKHMSASEKQIWEVLKYAIYMQFIATYVFAGKYMLFVLPEHPFIFSNECCCGRTQGIFIGVYQRN